MPEGPTFAEPDAGALLLPFAGSRREIDEYERHGGYDALKKALGMTSEQLVDEMIASNLRGRGGAGFPAGRKASFLAQGQERHLVINGDESEPGTFKDRVIMEGDPFSLVEAMTIAAFAIGAEEGFIYLRGEYPEAERALQHAIDEAYHHGYLGDDIMGEGVAFDLEIRRGAGAYICGEETAIFNSIEGFRGEPRSKPPFPVESGVFHKPTAINNVETLVNVLSILDRGGPGYADTGTEASTGTKLSSIASAASRAPTRKTTSPGPALTVSAATSGEPVALPRTSTGSTRRSRTPSRPWYFCVATQVPMTRASCISRQIGRAHV